MPQIGEANHLLRPIVRLVVRGNFGRTQTIEARLDTGFDLYMALPASIIAALGLDYVRERDMTIANGQAETLAEYRARILWEGIERPIRVLANPASRLSALRCFKATAFALNLLTAEKSLRKLSAEIPAAPRGGATGWVGRIPDFGLTVRGR